MNNNATYPQEPHEVAEDPLYVMTVELEKGKSESIKIYSDSKAEELAYEFCKKNNLDFVSLDYLTTQIRSLFNNVSNPNHPLIQNNSISNNNNNNNKNNQEQKRTECIMEEEEDDNHNHNNINNEEKPSDHYINFQPEPKNSNMFPSETNYFNRYTEEDEDHNHDQEEKKDTNGNHYLDKEGEGEGEGEGGEEDGDEEWNNQINSDKDMNRNSQLDSNSLFSYNEFYNRLKRKLVEREQKYALTRSNQQDIKYISKFSRTTTTIPYSKESNSPELLSITYNERKYNEFLRKYNNLDDIYQNKHHPNCNLNLNLYTHTHNSGTYNCISDDNHHKHQHQHQHNPHQSGIESEAILRSQLNLLDSGNITSLTQYRPKSNSHCIKLTESGMKERSNSKSMKISSKANCDDYHCSSNNTMTPVNNTRSRAIAYTYLNKNSIPGSPNYFKRNIKYIKGNISYSDKYKQFNRKNNNKSIVNKYNKQYKHKHTYTCVNEENKDNTGIDVVFTKKKEEIFKKIFYLLDSNQDKSINIITMDTSRIPSTIYNIIKPLIYELKHSVVEKIDETEFITGCMKLFEGLPFNNRRALLDFSTKIRANCLIERLID